MRPAFIAEYVRQCAKQGELGNWTIRLASRLPEGAPDEIAGHSIGLITRSHSKSSEVVPGRYTIKRVLSPADELCDLTPEQYERALKATQEAAKGQLNRKGEPLDPDTPVVGLCVTSAALTSRCFCCIPSALPRWPSRRGTPSRSLRWSGSPSASRSPAIS